MNDDDFTAIAARLGIRVEEITFGQVFDWRMGDCEEGACCTRWPLRDYRQIATAPAVGALPYRIVAAEWPQPPYDLITEGGDA